MSIRCEHVSKNYRQGDKIIEVLRDLSFEIPTGGSISILGQSGSGKSTLLSLMSGLDRPDQGSIHIESVCLNEMSESQMTQFRGKQIGIVFQQFHLMSHLTALENAGLPRLILGYPDWRDRAAKLLSDLGLGGRLEHFPGQLSGGECQRVAIARALLNEPRLLLADEPTGNLDSRTAKTVGDQFFDVVAEKKVTLMLVTHNEELARRCARRGELREGKLWF